MNDLKNDYRVFKEIKTLKKDLNLKIKIYGILRPKDKLRTSHGLQFTDYAEVELIEVPFNHGKFLYFYVWLVLFFKLLFVKCEIFHAHDLDMLVPIKTASFIKRKKVIYDSHEIFSEQIYLINKSFEKRVWKFLEKLFIKGTTVITVNDSIAKWLKQQYKVHQISVVKNIPEISIHSRPYNIESKFPNIFEKKLILYQGTIYDEYEELIDIISDYDEYNFLFIGKTQKKNIFRSKGKNVFYHESVSVEKLKEITKKADIGLCLLKKKSLSHYYSLPNKIFEYLQAGIPIIASNFPEISEVVDINGFGVLIDNWKDIGNAAARILIDKTIKENAVKNKDKYSWKHESEKLIKFYKNVL